MKWEYVSFIAWGLLFTVIFSSCRTSAYVTKAKSIDGIMHKYDSKNEPGASVLVMQKGKILFKKGYGVTDIFTGEEIHPGTNFRLASITKQFTAMSILLLEERGELTLSDPITKYFPDFPGYGHRIIIKHLLTHSSGLIDYEDLMPASQSVQLHDQDCLQLMYTTDKLYFPAGTEYRYSNTGYALLALIVEKVSARPFAQFLKENIFFPLKMNTTVAFEEGKSSIVNRAIGHSNEEGRWKKTDQSLTSAVLGDGGIYSNGVELSRWVEALFENPLISPQKQAEAFSRTTLKNGKTIDYGFGWHVEELQGITHPYHDGSTMGFRNNIMLFPEQKLMVVVLTNRNEGDPKEEATAIARLFLD
jgi:CubicO group peptidase (beta-lactamase class C family)